MCGWYVPDTLLSAWGCISEETDQKWPVLVEYTFWQGEKETEVNNKSNCLANWAGDGR